MERGKIMLHHLAVLEADAQRQRHFPEGLVGRHILLVAAREVLERHQQLLMEETEALHQPVQYHHL
jgi:hypothetical protein